MTHFGESISALLPEKRDKAITAVAIRPDMTFETQNPTESVSILLRQHFITNFGWIASVFLLAFVPPALFVLLTQLGVDILNVPYLKLSYIVVSVIMWYQILFTVALMEFLDWYFNIYLITSERALDFDFNAFAYHKVSEAGLDSIVDATEEAIGFFPMLFNYGDVYIQTAGEKREFDFLSVPNPGWVRDKIMDLRDLVISTPK